MNPGSNPFEPRSADPFGPPHASASAPPSTGPFGQGPPMGASYGAPPSADYNTFAVLSPIFAVVVPPAGVVLGHLALPQIRRTGERGRAAAIAGLVIGYLMCVVLIAALIWWLTSDSGSNNTAASSSPTAATNQVPSTIRALHRDVGGPADHGSADQARPRHGADRRVRGNPAAQRRRQ